MSICRRCNYREFAYRRNILNMLIVDHFEESHKRRPEPEPRDAGKCTIANPYIHTNDYSIYLMSKIEYEKTLGMLCDEIEKKVYWASVNKCKVVIE